MSFEEEEPSELVEAGIAAEPEVAEPEVDEAALAAAQQAAVVRGLRRYFRQHNIQAFILAMFSLLTSAILWALIYVLAYWLSLVVVTLTRSFNEKTLLQVTETNLIGPRFPWYFAGGALLSLVIAGLARKHFQPTRLREARFYVLWLLAELLLAVPNTTFAIWGNLSAITRLRRHDAVAAARLIERMDASEGTLSLSNMRVEIEDEKTLQRVLFGLQLVGLVGLRERERGWFLVLEKPGTLALLSGAAKAAAV